MTTVREFCTFRLDGSLYGIDVQDVREVFRDQEATRVPLAPAVVRGLINLRGQIVTTIDLRRRLGLPTGDIEEPIHVLVRTEHELVSLLVDEIGEVIETRESDFETPPETMDRRARELIRGAYKLEGELLLVLDTESMAVHDATE